jgi:Bacteriophage minor capsid protein
MSRGWTTQLLTGLAERLAAGGAGVWHDPDGVLEPYGSGETAIILGAMPPEPERVVLISPYPVSSDTGQDNVIMGIQVRVRAGSDPRDAIDLEDAIYDLLHGKTHLTLGGVDVVQILRQSSTSLGQARDQSARWERSSNYYLWAMRPWKE